MSIFCKESHRSIESYGLEIRSLHESINAFRTTERLFTRLDRRDADINGRSGISSRILEIIVRVSSLKESIALDLDLIKNARCMGFKISTKKCFYFTSSILETSAAITGGVLAYYGDDHEDTESPGTAVKNAGIALIVVGIALSKFNDYVSSSIRELQKKDREFLEITVDCDRLKENADYLYSVFSESEEKYFMDTTDSAGNKNLEHQNSIEKRWKTAVEKLVASCKSPFFSKLNNNEDTSEQGTNSIEHDTNI